MGGDISHSNKRKRPTAVRSESAAPAAKRRAKTPSSPESSADTKQHTRKIIKAVYKRYNLLNDTEAAGQNAAYDALLDACEGEPAARRLAARLVPRFAARFPDKLDAAARALMDLSAWDGARLPASKLDVAEATRLDALKGLGDICNVAASQTPDSRTASSIILHLLRRSQQSKARAKRMVPPAAEQESIRETTAAILLGSPKAMLSACLESLGYGSGELFEAAREAMTMSLEAGHGKKNGAVGESLLFQALGGDAKVSEWFAMAVQSLKGQNRHADIARLLDDLASAAPRKRKPAGKTKSLVPASASANAKSSEGVWQADSKTSGEVKLEASKAAKLSKVESKAAKPEAQRVQSAAPAPEAAEATDPRVWRAPEAELPSTVVSSLSAVPEHVIANGSAIKRFESGELTEDGPVNGRIASSGRDGSMERQPQEDGPMSERGILATLPRPGGNCCVVFECLWIGGIASHLVKEAQLRRECEEFGPIKRVLILPPPALNQALVFFYEMSHATACYEGLNGEVRLARRPLEVQFCQDSPEVASRPDCPPRQYVWMALYSDSEVRREAVMHDLAEAGIEKPADAIRVGGSVPGLMLQFSSSSVAAAAVKALMPSRKRPSSRSPTRDAPAMNPAVAIPDFATSTLWIGQVGPDVDEQELISAFRRHGPLIGYKLLRSSNCGFIDFECVEHAAAAREALHNAKFASCDIRVEFKEEGRAIGRVAGFGGRGPGRFGRGRGRGRFDAHLRPPLRESSPPGFRSRESQGFSRSRRESPPYGRSPRSGRSRSPIPSRRRSPPYGGRPWSPPRSPGRGRRGNFHGRRGGRYLGSPCRRGASPEPPPPRPDRFTRRDAGEPLATSVRGDRDRPASSKWDKPARPPSTATGISPGTSHPAPYSPHWAPGKRPKPAGSESGAAPSMPPPPTEVQSMPDSPPKSSNPAPPLPPRSVEHLAPPAVVEYSRDGVVQSTPTWSGRLAKSGSIVCSIQCLEGPRRECGGANGLEPVSWPSILDVTLRIDIKYVLQTVSSTVTGNLAAVRRLVVAPDSEQADSQARFKEFCKYLTTRGRAGVVQHIPPASGLAERTMYLIPPTPAVAQDLKAQWIPQNFMLMALIVPAKL